MTRLQIWFRALLALLSVVWFAARAAGAEIPLGEIPKYADDKSARAACGDDPVVWADQKSGFFYPRFHPDFGKTPHGVYTCYGRAKKADYWSLTPEGDGGREGREFPQVFCTRCS